MQKSGPLHPAHAKIAVAQWEAAVCSSETPFNSGVVCSHTRVPSAEEYIFDIYTGGLVLRRVSAEGVSRWTEHRRPSRKGKRKAFQRFIRRDAGREQQLAAGSSNNGPLRLLPDRSPREQAGMLSNHTAHGNTASANGTGCKVIALEGKLALKIPRENGFLLHIRKTKNFQ